MNADGGDFFCGDAAARKGPDAGGAGNALGEDAELRAGADEDLLKEPNEIYRTEVGAALAGERAAEIDDGVADELARAVVGDVAAAIDFMQGDAFAGEELIRGEDVGAAGVAAEGEDGRVLEENEGIGDHAGFACGDEALLEGEGLRVRDAAEGDKVDEQRTHSAESKRSA